MNLYIATRWGNNQIQGDDGPNGPDTNYLVRAETHEKAAELADLRLSNQTNDGMDDKCHLITQIGEDNHNTEETVVLGPWISYAMLNGTYKSWKRDLPTQEKWLESDK